MRWAAASAENWRWLCSYATALAAGYSVRFGRTHKSADVIRFAVAADVDNRFACGERTPFAQAMPDECRATDAVDAYRRYYASHKRRGKRGRLLATWRRTAEPPWWTEYADKYQEETK